MEVCIVPEFCQGKPFCPVHRPRAAHASYICFKPLIESFSLSITLRVIRGNVLEIVGHVLVVELRWEGKEGLVVGLATSSNVN
ncbi:hypothetical protein LIER_43408 [Lithospermum erythrorhizon]|uniref:Uncharacterized protein n=1 Tax=Lithospermum erythrorhizon TaxID=34254 RepID=A0AAV3Q1H5_LITER